MKNLCFSCSFCPNILDMMESNNLEKTKVEACFFIINNFIFSAITQKREMENYSCWHHDLLSQLSQLNCALVR